LLCTCPLTCQHLFCIFRQMEYRGVIQPLASIPEHEQRASLKGLPLAEIYVLGRDCTHEDIIRQQRPGRALVVPWAAVAARQRGRKDSRYASLLEFRDEIH